MKDTERARCFAGNLAWLLYRAHWGLAAELTAALAPLGVSARDYHVLRAALSGEHTQTELAEMIGLDKTTMVVAVDELERAGLAERHPAPDDRRARIIAVTAGGKRKVAEADKVKERVQAEVLGDLSAREAAALIEGLSKLVEGRLSEPAECSPPLRRRVPRR
ncbi:MAG: winged helix-turn-helix transcriptional regulator [Solirubrobacterales bacterium]|nr:winged helix-turn-helix transcriptional regulator [Solirubrobacterales bacterium]MBV9167957.1 winged helix-turn-helix transcriptional regulator [Solirubrobacterales bacterium]MBV9534285.1 winged helix-turn-helix transcriptional regulator [Solirubrobacterales bacterium]